MSQLAGRVAIVTGGVQGIGLGVSMFPGPCRCQRNASGASGAQYSCGCFGD